MCLKSTFNKIKHKIFFKKIRIKRKNYMYQSVDEVHIQKVYYPNWPFYLKLIIVPMVIVLLFVTTLGVFNPLSQFLSSIIFGIFGSYIASVVVTWLVDKNTCKIKTMERMRFQHVYCSGLNEICGGFIFFYISYLAKYFPNECSQKLRDGPADFRYFKGHPWQYWTYMLNDLLQKKYTFYVEIDGELSCEWMTEKATKYRGALYEAVKPAIENEAKTYFELFLNNSDFIDRVTTTINSYRSSLANVYVNDHISKLQLDLLSRLIDCMQEYVDCFKGKKYAEFWNANDGLLTIINILSREFYPLRDFRENENIYHITYRENGDARIQFDVPANFVDDKEHPIYSCLPRSEYWKLKKQRKINEMFNKENHYTIR